ncbi:hypothetical protein [Polaribacter porphyrae]|uniref:Uncharacterized protein n=1 Tax=Polaribacter porphyrae TaxID=1137780 RepID=A0A2S7WKM1_9FLAO|nr:hypothetical protein [Polaribacter porphyrae]PQJ77986.1 hypothetical protein BTO18_01745 [Polaribacter porphyrae]
MIEKLFVDLFEKIKREEGANNKNAIAVFFVNTILENYGKSRYISEKKTSRYYEKYIENKPNVSVGNPDETLKEIISKYLGYQDYRHFIINFNNEVLENRNNASSITSSEVKENFKEQKKGLNVNNKSTLVLKIASILLISIIGLFGLNYYFTDDNCIIWKENHYETTSCKTKNSLDNKINTINIEQFKKIEVDDKTAFFKNGNPIIWYGKSPKGKIEFFTQRGKHPETLNELKPITEGIINKYVYTNNEDKTILE